MSCQLDTYLREFQIFYSFLQEVNKLLALSNLPSTKDSWLMNLARVNERKTKDFYSTHKELEFLHSQNASPKRELKELDSASLVEFNDSFENKLQQVEHFHLPLVS